MILTLCKPIAFCSGTRTTEESESANWRVESSGLTVTSNHIATSEPSKEVALLNLKQMVLFHGYAAPPISLLNRHRCAHIAPIILFSPQTPFLHALCTTYRRPTPLSSLSVILRPLIMHVLCGLVSRRRWASLRLLEGMWAWMMGERWRVSSACHRRTADCPFFGATAALESARAFRCA